MEFYLLLNYALFLIIVCGWSLNHLKTHPLLSMPSFSIVPLLQVFDKALDEPNYSSMYAQLCLRLNDFVVPQLEDQNAGVSGI